MPSGAAFAPGFAPADGRLRGATGRTLGASASPAPGNAELPCLQPPGGRRGRPTSVPEAIRADYADTINRRKTLPIAGGLSVQQLPFAQKLSSSKPRPLCAKPTPDPPLASERNDLNFLKFR